MYELSSQIVKAGTDIADALPAFMKRGTVVLGDGDESARQFPVPEQPG